ncbi:MAG: hypothetical protein H6969_06770 [Gammaproteobacteria bacterium]|nr:hypothetical protein [Gammaproteobacteria bacterium]
MKQRVLAVCILVGILIGGMAIVRHEDALPPGLLQMREERDNKICQVRFELANLSVDYLAALEQLKNTWEIEKYYRNSEEHRLFCAWIVSEGGSDSRCNVRGQKTLIDLKVNVTETANELMSGEVRYRLEIEEIQRQFLLSLGIYDFQKSQSIELTKLPSCAVDGYIEEALKQLHST